MYFLYRYHHKLPHEYMSLPIGERKIVNAFISFEIEKRQEEIDSIRND